MFRIARASLFPIVFAALLAGAAARGQTVADFFNDGELQSIHVRMKPADWQALKDHYLENTYYRAELEWRGVVIPDIGIRSRGTGSRSPVKPALGLDFSRYNKAGRFLSLKGLVLRNFIQDATMVHEHLAQKLFQRMGLPYSRTVHTPLYINDEYVGLYLAVEPIDSRFLRTHFGEDAGFLYEMQGGQGYNFQYLGPEGERYCPSLFEPKNHEDAPECEKLAEWVRQMNDATEEEFPEEMEEYTDVAAFLTHLAVDQFMADWDSILTDGGMTNFYCYRRAADNRWVFMTWDKDMAFTVPEQSVWWNTDRNVFVRRALSQPEWRRRYLEALWQASEIAGGAGGWLAQEAQRMLAQIRQAVRDDPNRLCSIDGQLVPCPFERFMLESEYLVNTTIPERYSRVRAEVLAAGFDPLERRYRLAWDDVASLADGVPPLSPNSLAALRIRNAVAAESFAPSFPLPRELDGVRVAVGGIDAPIVRTTPDQVIFQVPVELPPGPVPVVFRRGSDWSNTLYADARPSAPALFAVTHAEGSLVTPDHPARAGELLVAWGTGFGPARGVATGDPAPLDRFVPLDLAVTGTLDRQAVRVTWAGLAPALASVDVIVFELPASLNPAGLFPLLFSVNEEPGVAWNLPVR